MPALHFYTLDVFTTRQFGGNPLAVFPAAPELPDETMLAIARELHLSETVFVRPASLPGASHRLRIFTPGGELPFAGHPTVGSAQLLFELGLVPVDREGGARFGFEEGVGLVPIEVVRSADGRLFTWLTAARVPAEGPAPPSAEVLAAALGIPRAEIVERGDLRPRIFSAGVPFTFIPLPEAATLGCIQLDLARWRAGVAESPAPKLYAFHLEPETRTVRARMFAPSVGIAEDAATGGAAAALAGFLWELTREAARWTISQGVEMGRPSTLHLEVHSEAGRLSLVRVGGTAVRVSEGVLQLAT